MKGSVFIAAAVAFVAMGIWYARSMGPRCGDGRCDAEQMCIVNDVGGQLEHVCEALPDECGAWPGCGCVEADFPSSYDCDDNIWGYVTVTAPTL